MSSLTTGWHWTDKYSSHHVLPQGQRGKGIPGASLSLLLSLGASWEPSWTFCLHHVSVLTSQGPQILSILCPIPPKQLRVMNITESRSGSRENSGMGTQGSLPRGTESLLVQEHQPCLLHELLATGGAGLHPVCTTPRTVPSLQALGWGSPPRLCSAFHPAAECFLFLSVVTAASAASASGKLQSDKAGASRKLHKIRVNHNSS